MVWLLSLHCLHKVHSSVNQRTAGGPPSGQQTSKSGQTLESRDQKPDISHQTPDTIACRPGHLCSNTVDQTTGRQPCRQHKGSTRLQIQTTGHQGLWLNLRHEVCTREVFAD